MTVSSSSDRMGYNGTGTTATYSYNFRIFAESEMAVVVRDSAGNETTLVHLTDYTITGETTYAGGNVALIGTGDWLDGSGFLAIGWYLALVRVLPVLQGTDFRNQSDPLNEDIEDALDRGIMVAQQQQDAINRSIHLPLSEDGTATATELPPAASRANGYLAFDPDGNLIVVADPTPSSYVKTVSASAPSGIPNQGDEWVQYVP